MRAGSKTCLLHARLALAERRLQVREPIVFYQVIGEGLVSRFLNLDNMRAGGVRSLDIQCYRCLHAQPLRVKIRIYKATGTGRTA